MKKNKEEEITEKIITNLERSCNDSDGDLFEEAVKEAITSISDSYFPLGGVTSRFRSFSDGYWLRNNNRGKKDIVIIIEIKSGNAIKSISPEKEKDNIKNTITKIKQSHPEEEIDNFLVWYVAGNNLLQVGSHGGNRYQDSLKNKLFKIQTSLQYLSQKSLKLTVFSLDCFISYYKYLRINKFHELTRIEELSQNALNIFNKKEEIEAFLK